MTPDGDDALPPLGVTAVVPTYNRRDHVGRAVRTILSQSVPPQEVIVVDDGSSDGTAEALQSEFGDALRIIRQANGGVSSARRRGLEEAQGDWIAFLDSDDEWTPDRQASLTRAVAACEGAVDWVFGDTEFIADGAPVSLFEDDGLELQAEVTPFSDPIPTQFPVQFSILESSLIRRRMLLDTGAFLEGLRSSEDFLVSFRGALSYRFAAIPTIVTRAYRTAELQSSSLSARWRDDPDYFRARVLAFGEAAVQLPDGPWGSLHAEAVRGWCRALAAQGQPCAQLSMSQFRHHLSLKAVGFAAVAHLGPAALPAWAAVSRLRALA